MSVLKYFKNTPLKYGGQGLNRGRGPCRPPQRATGPCRPWGGRQGLFFVRDLVANLKKKNYT